MLEKGQPVPHFAVTDINGMRVVYTEAIWQRRHLLLITLAPATSPDEDAYLSRIHARLGELSSLDTTCVITRETVPDTPRPGIVVADRWGEIQHVAGAARVGALPNVDDLLDWLHYVEQRCPECEGEAR